MNTDRDMGMPRSVNDLDRQFVDLSSATLSHPLELRESVEQKRAPALSAQSKPLRSLRVTSVGILN
jgi:hypothetical protein